PTGARARRAGDRRDPARDGLGHPRLWRGSPGLRGGPRRAERPRHGAPERRAPRERPARDLQTAPEAREAPVRRRARAGRSGAAEALDADARAVVALSGEVQRSLRARRRAGGALGFGDLIRLARDGLLERPDLQARATEELDVLLVDEFQDTSRVQRDLVLLLCQATAAARRRAPGVLPDPSELRPRGLVVVGDRKQSIYAFRGADVSVYARFAAELAGQAAAEALDLRGVRASA